MCPVFTGERRGGPRQPQHNSSEGFEWIDTKQTRWFPWESEEGSISAKLLADKCRSPGTINRDVTAPQGNGQLPSFHVTKHEAQISRGRRNLEIQRSFLYDKSLYRLQSHAFWVQIGTLCLFAYVLHKSWVSYLINTSIQIILSEFYLIFWGSFISMICTCRDHLQKKVLSEIIK